MNRGAAEAGAARVPRVDPRGQAQELAARLNGIGFRAVVEPWDPCDPESGHWEFPVVMVSTGKALRVHGVARVFVAPEGHRKEPRLCFWWSPSEPIAPLSDLGGAVMAVTRMLPCPGEGCRACAEAEPEDGEFEW